MSQIIARAYEDCGNPNLETDIIRTPDGFLLRPFRSGFHLNVELVNPAETAIETVIEIEWGKTHESDLRDYLILHSEGDRLTWLTAPTTGSRQRVQFAVPPGSHCLCLNHRYETARLTRLTDSLDRNIFQVRTIGKSRMGRDLIGIEAGNPAVRPVTIVARVHPYETPGSFFVEGMLHWLHTPEGSSFLEDRRLAFVPMANPDGVAIGNGYLTYGGLNISADVLVTTEPEAVALREYFVGLNPYLTADFHGWMHRYDDNITTNSLERGKALYAAMIPYSRGIDMQYAEYPLAGGRNNIGGVLIDQCGADFFNCSWIPRGRSVERLHEIGVAFLKAIAA